MRRYALMLAAAAGMALCPLTKADFVISSVSHDLSTTDLGAGKDSGLKLIEYFAKGTGGSTTAFGDDIVLTDPAGNLVVGYGSRPTAGTAADVTGVNEVFTTGASTYSYGGINASFPYYSFVNLLGDPTNSAQNGPGKFNNFLSTTPVYPSAAVPSFEVSGITTNGVGVDAVNANGGRGALIAVAVVPTGDMANLTGAVSDQAGTSFPVSSVPEPASFSLLALAGIGLVRRRRQA